MILERKPDWQTPSSASSNFFAGPRSNSVAKNPLGRVAAFLLTLSRQNEQEGRDPVVLTQPLQCGVVADFLALSIDRLGSLLVQLKRRCVIEETPGALHLTDIAALETLAGNTGLRDYKDPIPRDVLTLER